MNTKWNALMQKLDEIEQSAKNRTDHIAGGNALWMKMLMYRIESDFACKSLEEAGY